MNTTLRGHSGTGYWDFQTDDTVISKPAVSSGRVYIGSNDNSLYAIDARSGERLGSYEIRGAVGSSPAVVNRIVYVGSNDGKIYALDARLEDDEPLWSKELGDAVTASPAVTDKRVYVGGRDGGLYALNIDNGDEVWDSPFSAYKGFSSPIVADNRIYFGSETGYVYSINKDKTDRKQYETDNEIPQSSPAVANNTVYVGSLDTNLYALSKGENESGGNEGENASGGKNESGGKYGGGEEEPDLLYLSLAFGALGAVLGLLIGIAGDHDTRQGWLDTILENIMGLFYMMVLLAVGIFVSSSGIIERYHHYSTGTIPYRILYAIVPGWSRRCHDE